MESNLMQCMISSAGELTSQKWFKQDYVWCCFLVSYFKPWCWTTSHFFSQASEQFLLLEYKKERAEEIEPKLVNWLRLIWCLALWLLFVVMNMKRVRLFKDSTRKPYWHIWRWTFTSLCCLFFLKEAKEI